MRRTLSGASGATGVPPHGNSLLVLLDVVEEGDGAGELQAADGLGSLAGVLEGDAEERTTALRRLGIVAGFGCVADL